MKFIQILVSLVFLTNLEIQCGNPHLTGSNKKKAVTNALNENILGINHRQHKQNHHQSQNLLQTKNKNEQYFDPQLSQFNDKSYAKQDFYLWEEGVTNLAYDDFLQTKFITNIEYLGTGYNLAYANPNPSKGIDPGYTTYSAFDFVYQPDKLKSLSTDADYFIPNGVKLRTKTACQVSFESKEISSMEEYSHSLESGLDVKGKILAFSFTASVDYKQASNEMKKQDTSLVSTNAECMVHNLEVDSFIQPKWSRSLNKALTHLVNNPNQDQAWEFFEIFGTHVAIGVELGAKFGYQFEMKSTEVEKMKQMGLSVEVGASGFGQDVSGYTNYQRDSSSAFSEAMTSWKQISIGALPDEDNDALKWAQTVRESPMPIKAKLLSWSDFVVKFSDGNTEFDHDELTQLQELFEQSIQTYCSGYLKPNSKVIVCSRIEEYKFKGVFGGYNVPGGQLDSNVDYTKIGGADGYKWQKLRRGCADIDIDSTGYIYCINQNFGIEYLKPGATQWDFLEGSGRKLSASNGKLVYINFQNKLRYKNIRFDEPWQNVNNSINFFDVCIDELGHIWGQTHDGLCYFNDHSDLNRCFSGEKRFVSCSGGVLYTAVKNGGEQAIKYGRGNAVIKEIALQSNSQPQNGCITKGGWGWKVQADNQLWYMENVEEWQQYGNTDVDGQGYKVACASTIAGPIVAMQDLIGDVYVRVVDTGEPEYLGCFIDDQSGRDVSDYKGSGYTPQTCIEKCDSESYPYAGLQYYGQCFCGLNYGSYGQSSESDCNTRCNADNSEICGGPNRNSVYKI